MDENKNENNNNFCPICLHFIKVKLTTNCKHDFCCECIMKALKYNEKQECPVCKQDLKTFSICCNDDDEFNKQEIQQQTSSSNTPFFCKLLTIVIYSVFIASICSIDNVKIFVNKIFFGNLSFSPLSLLIQLFSIDIVVIVFLIYIVFIDKFIKIDFNITKSLRLKRNPGFTVEEEGKTIKLYSYEVIFFLVLIILLYSTIVAVCISVFINLIEKYFPLNKIFLNTHYWYFLIMILVIFIICFVFFLPFPFKLFKIKVNTPVKVTKQNSCNCILVIFIIVIYSIIVGVCSTFVIEKVKLFINKLFWSNSELYYWSFFITVCSIFMIIIFFIGFVLVIHNIFKKNDNFEEEEKMDNSKVELTQFEYNLFMFLLIGIYSVVVGICITLGIQNGGKLFIKTLFWNIHFLSFFIMILVIFIIVICFVFLQHFTFKIFLKLMKNRNKSDEFKKKLLKNESLVKV